MNRCSRQDYARLFHSDTGQKILKDLACQCGVYSSSFVPHDPQHTAFLEGKRAVWLYLSQQLQEAAAVTQPPCYDE